MGNTGPDRKGIIQLNQAVKQLIYRPDNGLVSRKCRIECGDAFGFIITENILPLHRMLRTGSNKKDRYENLENPHPELRVKLKL
jgi:hypothetical protein